MAVEIAGTPSSEADNNTATHTFSSYALDANANCIVVGVSWFNATTITGVTWNGAAMDSAGAEIEDSDGHKAQIFYQVSPGTGTHDIAVTFSGSTDGSTIGATGLSGVDTSTPVVASSFNSGQAASPSGAASPATVTTGAAASSGDLAVSVISMGNVTFTASNGATQLWNTQGSLFSTNFGAASYLAGTGTLDMQWTYTGTHEWAEAVVIFKASSGGGGGGSTGYKIGGVRLRPNAFAPGFGR